jgi:hypothetical protein
MTRDDFFADPIGCWFSALQGRIEPDWFAAAWRSDPAFREEVLHNLKRYVLKLGVIAEPEVVGVLARSLTRDEVLAVAEDLRQHAPGRLLEWGAAFERASAPLGLVLPVPPAELGAAGRALVSAVFDRDLDRVRFVVRCMRATGLDPTAVTFEEYVTEMTVERLGELPDEERERFMESLDSLPVRQVRLVEHAEHLGLREFVEAIRSGAAEAAPSAAADPARDIDSRDS